MTKQARWFGSVSRLKLRRPIPALLVAVLLVAGVGLTPLAEEGPSDEDLASQLQSVILDQTISPGAVTTVIEIPVSQDTYVASNKPSTNYGRSSELRLGYNNQGNRDGALRTLIEFNVVNYIPQGAVINHATLQIFLFATGGRPAVPMGSDARQLQTAWDEDLVTWNSHQPAWGGVVRHSNIPWVLGWHYADVTDLVREWLSPGHTNNGVIIIGDERIQERQLKFTSINANNNQYPRLVGFADSIDKEFFSLFVSVPGLGIKKALKSLIIPISDVARAIETDDAAILQKMPGIGARLAEKIIAELKGKTARFALAKGSKPLAKIEEKPDYADEVLEILLQLQYKRAEAQTILHRAISTGRRFKSSEESLQQIFKQSTGVAN